jgi:hypothetical protein
LLDSGPLGQACRRFGIAAADQCRLWIDSLIARVVEVVVPEVADYEVRRELTRINAVGSLRRLDDLVTLGGLSYQPGPPPFASRERPTLILGDFLSRESVGATR